MRKLEKQWRPISQKYNRRNGQRRCKTRRFKTLNSIAKRQWREMCRAQATFYQGRIGTVGGVSMILVPIKYEDVMIKLREALGERQ